MAASTILYNFLIHSRFRAGRHVLLVLVLALIAFNQIYLTFSNYTGIPGDKVLLSAVGLWMAYVAVVYFNIYMWIPRFLIRKRYVLYGTCLSLCIVLFLCVKLLIEYAVFSGSGIFRIYNYVTLLDNISYFVLDTICIVGTSVPVLLRLWMEDRERISRLEKERLKSEVEQMKEQINPRFLFEILGYTSEAVEREPERSSDMLMRLSRLLKYELYDCNREKVLLNSDLTFVSGYLDLEKMYAGDFEYSLFQDGNPGALFIPSLLLIAFVQHTLEQLRRAGSAKLNLFLQVKEKQIFFRCEAGGIDPGDPAYSRIRQRLDLLYGGDYTLSVRRDGWDLRINALGYAG